MRYSNEFFLKAVSDGYHNFLSFITHIDEHTKNSCNDKLNFFKAKPKGDYLGMIFRCDMMITLH